MNSELGVSRTTNSFAWKHSAGFRRGLQPEIFFKPELVPNFKLFKKRSKFYLVDDGRNGFHLPIFELDCSQKQEEEKGLLILAFFWLK